MAHGVEQAVFGLGTGSTTGFDNADDLRDTVRTEANMRTSLAGGDIVYTTICAGVDEQAGDDPYLEGITTSDTVLSVVVVRRDEDGLLQEVKHRAAGDFVAGTDEIVSTANLEDNQGNFYIVTWVNAS